MKVCDDLFKVFEKLDIIHNSPGELYALRSQQWIIYYKEIAIEYVIFSGNCFLFKTTKSHEVPLTVMQSTNLAWIVQSLS